MMAVLRLNMFAGAMAALLTTGCAAGARVEGLPENARLEKEAKGGHYFLATAPATVYVVDKDGRRIVYSREMRFGETLVVNPNRRQIIVNGEEVQKNQIHPDHVIQIYVVTE